MAQHDRIEETREQPPESDGWDDMQGGSLDTATPEPLWQLVGTLGSQLLQQHPLLFWSGIWVTIFLTAGFAVTGLMNPELSTRDPLAPPASEDVQEIEEVDKTAVVQTPAPSVTEAVSPIWLFGAIAISCGFGSLLLAQCFKQHQSAPSLIDDRESLSANRLDQFPKTLSDELAGNQTDWLSSATVDPTSAWVEEIKLALPKPITSRLETHPPDISPLALQEKENLGVNLEGDRRTPPVQSQSSVPLLPEIIASNGTLRGDRRRTLEGFPSTQTDPEPIPGLDELMTIQQRRKRREPES